MQHPHLTIELPNLELAQELRGQLTAFDVDTVEANPHWELRIHLDERGLHARVANALNAIDRWLPAAGVEFVRVQLDGSSYTLNAPPPDG